MLGIIGILAAIAVTNFLNAQTRAKVPLYLPSFKAGDFILMSFGPGADTTTTLNFGLPYQPSNGLNSAGEI